MLNYCHCKILLVCMLWSFKTKRNMNSSDNFALLRPTGISLKLLIHKSSEMNMIQLKKLQDWASYLAPTIFTNTKHTLKIHLVSSEHVCLHQVLAHHKLFSIPALLLYFIWFDRATAVGEVIGEQAAGCANEKKIEFSIGSGCYMCLD